MRPQQGISALGCFMFNEEYFVRKECRQENRTIDVDAIESEVTSSTVITSFPFSDLSAPTCA